MSNLNNSTIIDSSGPSLQDFFDFETNEVDTVEYHQARAYWLKKRDAIVAELRVSKPFCPRKSVDRRDKTTSQWYVDYVIDVGKVYDETDSPAGKLYGRRFSHSKFHVKELTARILDKEHGFWKENCDAFGRPPIPTELLVLGSLRILTRNWTFDCINEATFISERSMKSFFAKFVTWYANVIFPTCVKLPELEELAENGIEYTIAGVPGSIGMLLCFSFPPPQLPIL